MSFEQFREFFSRTLVGEKVEESTSFMKCLAQMVRNVDCKKVIATGNLANKHFVSNDKTVVRAVQALVSPLCGGMVREEDGSSVPKSLKEFTFEGVEKSIMYIKLIIGS